ncbi:hypothetical protein BGX27_002439, partial [Mortierella sp. AM989]
PSVGESDYDDIDDEIFPEQYPTFHHNPQMRPRPVEVEYFPSKKEMRLYPALTQYKTFDFFRFQLTDEQRQQYYCLHPQHATQQYSLPPLSTQLKCSSAWKKVDTYLVKLQKQVAKLTRPVDALIHQGLTIKSEEDELMEAVLSYAQGMRLQLSDLAGTINKLRTDFVDKDKRIYNVVIEDSLITPQQLVERAEAGKALANAFKENDLDKIKGIHAFNNLRNNSTITVTAIAAMTMPGLGLDHLIIGTKEKSVPAGSHTGEASTDDERTGSRGPAPEVRGRMAEYFRPPGYYGHSAGRIQDSINASDSNLAPSTTRPSHGTGRHGGTR